MFQASGDRIEQGEALQMKDIVGWCRGHKGSAWGKIGEGGVRKWGIGVKPPCKSYPTL